MTAGSIEEVNELRARAEAVRVYTRQAELGREAENAAEEIRLRAERRVGELLRQTQRNVSGQPRTGRDDRPVPLTQLGVSKDESSAFQRMAAIPEDDFEGRLTTAKQSGRVSRAAVLRVEDAASLAPDPPPGSADPARARTLHEGSAPRPPPGRAAARAVPPGHLLAVLALAPLLLASGTDDVAANCPPLKHPEVVTVAVAWGQPKVGER